MQFKQIITLYPAVRTPYLIAVLISFSIFILFILIDRVELNIGDISSDWIKIESNFNFLGRGLLSQHQCQILIAILLESN